MEDFGKKIRLAIPKGSLQEYALRVFEESGFNIKVPQRGYVLEIDDPEIECFLLRPQEIPKYLMRGKIDVGICGDDCVLEAKAIIIEVCDLRYAKKGINKVRWVSAVPEKSEIKTVKDLEGKVVSTEMVNLAEDYFKKNKVKAKVEFSWGATEAKPPLFADAIIDLTETGASLRANNLKILDTVLESSTKLVASRESWKNKWKQEKILNLATLLQGGLRGEEITTLMLHIPAERLKVVLKALRGRKVATRKLTGEDWYDVSFCCGVKDVKFLIPKLKRLGCQDIIQSPAAGLIP